MLNQFNRRGVKDLQVIIGDGNYADDVSGVKGDPLTLSCGGWNVPGTLYQSGLTVSNSGQFARSFCDQTPLSVACCAPVR